MNMPARHPERIVCLTEDDHPSAFRAAPAAARTV